MHFTLLNKNVYIYIFQEKKLLQYAFKIPNPRL